MRGSLYIWRNIRELYETARNVTEKRNVQKVYMGLIGVYMSGGKYLHLGKKVYIGAARGLF